MPEAVARSRAPPAVTEAPASGFTEECVVERSNASLNRVGIVTGANNIVAGCSATRNNGNGISRERAISRYREPLF